MDGNAIASDSFHFFGKIYHDGLVLDDNELMKIAIVDCSALHHGECNAFSIEEFILKLGHIRFINQNPWVCFGDHGVILP
jgi:hypothetical protein